MVDNAVNLFHSSETNYVDTVAVSYDAVHNDNMAKLWSQLMTYSDGQFLQNGEKELDELPRDEWCASWFRRLPRFSVQSLVAGMLEIALLKAYSQREQPKKKKKIKADDSKNKNKKKVGSSSSSSGPAKRLAPGSSQRLLQVERLSDFWKTLTVQERHGLFQQAYKNVNDLVTQHGKEVKRTKTTDTMKEEKNKIHEWFTKMFRAVDQSSDWDSLDYTHFFMDLTSTPLVKKKNRLAQFFYFFTFFTFFPPLTLSSISFNFFLFFFPFLNRRTYHVIT
jgi:hypothetical protein